MTTPTLVLVHGAFHGPWCFEVVRPLLEERGIPTIAPELPLLTLSGDVARVRRALDSALGPIVLVGHSYGGTVITWAGEHPAVRSLVFISAGVPDVGEGIGSGPPATAPRPVLDGFVRADDGSLRVDPAHAVQLFYAQADPLVAAAWVRRLRPCHTGEGEVVPCAAWRTRPAHYVLCRNDRVLPAATQRWLAHRAAAAIHELETDHSPFLSQPGALVDILAGVAAAASHD